MKQRKVFPALYNGLGIRTVGLNAKGGSLGASTLLKGEFRLNNYSTNQEDKIKRKSFSNLDRKSANPNLNIEATKLKNTQGCVQMGSLEYKGPGKTNEFDLNLGHAIDILRSEIENFLQAGLVETDIYAKNISLVEPNHTKFSVTGITNYTRFAKLVKFMMNLFFRDSKVTIKKVVQMDFRSKNILEIYNSEINLPNKKVGPNLSELEPGSIDICIHWYFTGVNKPFSLISFSNEPSIYHGIFVYKFDKTGRVYEHVVTDILPHPSSKVITAIWRQWEAHLNRKRTAFDLNIK